MHRRPYDVFSSHVPAWLRGFTDDICPAGSVLLLLLDDNLISSQHLVLTSIFLSIDGLEFLQTHRRTCNTKLNDSRKNIYLRKSDVSVERISVCNVIEQLAEHVYTVCHASIPMTS